MGDGGKGGRGEGGWVRAMGNGREGGEEGGGARGDRAQGMGGDGSRGDGQGARGEGGGGGVPAAPVSSTAPLSIRDPSDISKPLGDVRVYDSKCRVTIHDPSDISNPFRKREFKHPWCSLSR